MREMCGKWVSLGNGEMGQPELSEFLRKEIAQFRLTRFDGRVLTRFTPVCGSHGDPLAVERGNPRQQPLGSRRLLHCSTVAMSSIQRLAVARPREARRRQRSTKSPTSVH
jgi:hypothetical protein